MIWIILQFIFLSLPFVLPMALYKSKRRFMAKFYDVMARSAKARKLYAQVLLILLLLFHYVYTSGHPGEFGVVLSTIVCAMLSSAKRADRWLRRLLDRPRAFVIFALVAMVIGFMPHLYTTAVTIACILLAALFYPSVRVMSEYGDADKVAGWIRHPGTFAESYHDNRQVKPPYDADKGNAAYSHNPYNDKSSKKERV